MISSSGESRKGQTVQLTDTEELGRGDRIWTIADASEAIGGTRLNVYLRGLKDNIDMYGVAVNRYWVNGSRGWKFPRRLMLVDDLVRVEADLPLGFVDWRGRNMPAYDEPVAFYEVRDHQSDKHPRDARYYQFGRYVVGLSADTVTLVEDMIDRRAEPSEVSQILSESRAGLTDD